MNPNDIPIDNSLPEKKFSCITYKTWKVVVIFYYTSASLNAVKLKNHFIPKGFSTFCFPM